MLSRGSNCCGHSSSLPPSHSRLGGRQQRMYWIHYNTSDGWTIELMRRAGWLAAHNNNVSSCSLARQLHQPQPQHSVTGAGDGGKTSSQHLMLLLVSEKCHYRVMMTSSDAQPGPDVGHHSPGLARRLGLAGDSRLGHGNKHGEHWPPRHCRVC